MAASPGEEGGEDGLLDGGSGFTGGGDETFWGEMRCWLRNSANALSATDWGAAIQCENG